MYDPMTLEHEAAYRHAEHLQRAHAHRLQRLAQPPRAGAGPLRSAVGRIGATFIALGVRLERAAGRYDSGRQLQPQPTLTPRVSWT